MTRSDAGRKTDEGVLKAAWSPMLAKPGNAPFSRKGWIFEPKFDGYRCIAIIDRNAVRLVSRNGIDVSKKFPSICKSLAGTDRPMIIDGEIVAIDENGQASFQLLQNMSGFQPGKPGRKRTASLIQYYVFDILKLDKEDLRSKTLAQRKKLLAGSLEQSAEIRLVEDLGEDGRQAFDACVKNGFEGVIAKKLDSKYYSGKRSGDWLKIKNRNTGDFLITGYTKGKGEREKTFGALVLAARTTNGLIHAGSVGTGFDTEFRKSLYVKMKEKQIEKSPLVNSQNIDAIWISPDLVAEVEFAEWTDDGKLRAPVFKRLREDKSPSQVEVSPIVDDEQKIGMQEGGAFEELLAELATNQDSLSLVVDGFEIALTNLSKPLWTGDDTEDSYTKRDYIEYLLHASSFMLPHLSQRPLTMIRYPHGIGGERFFQRHWSEDMPPYVDSMKMFSKGSEKAQTYVLCNNLPTLIWLAQIACLEIHVTHTRFDPAPDGDALSIDTTASEQVLRESMMNYPDFMVFDLDPYIYSGKERGKEEPQLNRRGFEETVTLALGLRKSLRSFDLNPFVKTSGRTGLHIYVPIFRNLTNEEVRDMTHTFGKHLQMELENVTLDWSTEKRKGKVFFDYKMNALNKTLPAPLSVRNSRQACISMPLHWDDLEKIYPTEFTIGTVPERLRDSGDPWKDILLFKKDIRKILS